MSPPLPTDPTSTIDSLLTIHHLCRLIAYICKTHHERQQPLDDQEHTIDEYPESLRGIYCGTVNLRSITEKVLNLVEPRALRNWPYISSWDWKPQRRSDGLLALCEQQLSILLGILRPIANWVSAELVPFPDVQGEYDRALKTMGATEKFLEDALSYDNGSLTLSFIEIHRELNERVRDFTRDYVKMDEDEKNHTIPLWLGDPDQSGYLIDALNCLETLPAEKLLIYQQHFLSSAEYARWKYSPDTPLLVYGISKELPLVLHLIAFIPVYLHQADHRILVSHAGYQTRLLIQIIDGIQSNILCAVALRDLESTPQPHPHIACAYFFFGYSVNPHSSRILTHALGSMIYSLVSRSMPPYPLAVTRLGVSYAQNSGQGSTDPYDEGQSYPSDQELVDALKSIAQAFDAVYLLLDSIDECSSSSGILKLIQSSREWNTDKIHILLTSCPTPKSLMELQGSINDKVVVGDASFDQVGFLISQLNDMEARASPLIHWLLAWICVSAKHLRVEEVQELLKVKLSSSEAISGPEEDIEDVLTTCGDFITVITSILNDGSLAPEIRRLIPRHVRLSQHPVRQVLLENYFRAEAETAGLAPEQYLHLLVSKACLSYLDGMEGFVGPADSQKYPLANYTARYWAWHLLQSGVTGYHNDPSMEGLVDRLFKWDSKQYFNWLQLYSIEPPSGGMESPLFRASYLGLEEIVQIALDRPERQHPNGLSSVGFVDPLGAAAGRGFREIVEILLIAGSKYGILDQHLVIPLVLAAEFNQKECVRTLLEFLCSRYFSTAGARQSQTAINTVLLKTGANLDLTRSTMRDLNPIKVATLKGFTPIVEMLLPHCDDKVAMAGLEVAACNKSKSLIEVYTSRFPNECMSYAAGLNWTEMVASLFQNGPSPKGTIHPASALQAAAYLGDEILVHSLLNAARPAKVNGFYSDAFHAAVAKGRLGSLKLLVGRGAKYSSQSRPAMRANSLACLGSAIQTASFYGHAEVVSYLLELDNINISAEQYLSAFQYAISQGHAEIVKILCPEYIDPKAYIQYDGILATSLSCAVRDNNMEIVKLLLKRGADINATSGLLADSKHYPKERWERRSQARETALELAAALGYVEIVELLFRNGADINRLGGARNGGEAGSGEPGDDRWRALHCAAYNCQLEVLKFLPKGKANISFRLLDSSTALHTAVSSHSPPWMIVECINILLEVGVHINAMDSAGKTALHLAGDRAQIVEHLIESEADPKIKDYKGMTIRQCIALASLKEKYSAGEQFMRWGEVAMVLGEMQIDSLVIRRRLGITQV